MELPLDRQRPEGTGVTFGDPAVDDGLLDTGVHLQQAKAVRDGRPRTTDQIRELSLCETELVQELAVGRRRLDRIEIGALEVLDESELELRAIGQLSDHGRDPLEPGELRGAKAALSSDQLVAVERLGHEDGLDDPVLADAAGEALER